jgi:peptide/nickel transport system substrate-binding protein
LSGEKTDDGRWTTVKFAPPSSIVRRPPSAEEVKAMGWNVATRRAGSLLAGLTALAMLAAACAPQAPASPAAQPGAKATGAPAAAGEPVRGGTLVFASEIEPNSMDPRLQNDTAAFRINELVYSGLFTVDPNLEPQPDLAERSENPNPTTWVFSLRKGVKFHDGSELTAEDVKYTYDTMLDPEFKSPRRALYDAIASVEAVDSHTVKFSLKYPFAALLVVLDHGIVPKAVAEKPGANLAANPVGSGPFKFVQWIKQDRIELEGFKEYHNGAPYLDKFTFRIIPDRNAQIVGIETGDIHLLGNVGPPNARDTKRLQESPKPGVQVLTTTAPGYTYVNLNLQRPALADAKVRQALAHLTDRETITRTIYAGVSTPGCSPLSPGTWAHDPAIRCITFDPARGKQLLDEAGWTVGPDGKTRQKDGQPLKLSIRTHTQDDQRAQVTELLQNAWREAGVDVEVAAPVQFSALIELLNKGDYDAIVVGWVALADPDRAMYRSFHSSSPSNWGKYVNPEVDKLLEQARQVSDRAERKKLYVEAANIVVSDAPYIFFEDQAYVNLVRDSVQGYVLNRSGNIKSVEKVWLRR